MATNYPGSKQTFPDPTSSTLMNAPGFDHTAAHVDLPDTVEALEDFVGYPGAPGAAFTDFATTAQLAAYAPSAGTYAATSTNVIQAEVTGDTNPRVQVTPGGISFGPGNAALDLTIARIVESMVVELQINKPIVPASYVKVTGDTGNNTAGFEANANSGGWSRLALLEAGVGTVLITKPAGAEQVQIWDGSSPSWVVQVDAANSVGNVRLAVKGITGQTGDLAQFNVAGTGPTFHIDSTASLILDDGATTQYRLVANSATLYLQHNNDINFCDINSGTARAVVGVDGHIGIQKNSTGANLYSGTGAPAAGTGSNGDFYLRTDTPGTANQRIYTKSAGAWVGIV